MGYLAYAAGVLLYLFPSFVATGRKNPRAGQIFALNIFLGWTFIGWVIALVWAIGKDKQKQA